MIGIQRDHSGKGVVFVLRSFGNWGLNHRTVVAIVAIGRLRDLNLEVRFRYHGILIFGSLCVGGTRNWRIVRGRFWVTIWNEMYRGSKHLREVSDMEYVCYTHLSRIDCRDLL